MTPLPTPALAVSASLALVAIVSPMLHAADLDGSSDHPLVPRVAGSEILSYNYRQLEQVAIPTGAADRLRAAGAGMMSPATSNRSESGRELNRRVELVEIVES